MKSKILSSEMVTAVLNNRKTVMREIIDKDIINNCDMEKDGTLLLYQDCNGDFINPVNLCRYKVGDILYVKETWHKYMKRVGKGESCHLAEFYGYKATIANSEDANEPWKSPVCMPKEAARIFLKVTSVRIERLQDITEEQAVKEGVSRLYDDLSNEAYETWVKKCVLVDDKNKKKEDWGYTNYLWHGRFGHCGTGNWRSDGWEYQGSSYDSAIDSFSSLWNSLLKRKAIKQNGWEANPYVWVIEFERCDGLEQLD